MKKFRIDDWIAILYFVPALLSKTLQLEDQYVWKLVDLEDLCCEPRRLAASAEPEIFLVKGLGLTEQIDTVLNCYDFLLLGRLLEDFQFKFCRKDNFESERFLAQGYVILHRLRK